MQRSHFSFSPRFTFICIQLLVLEVMGLQPECEGNSQSVKFVKPVHDTAVSIEDHGKLATEIRLCGFDDRLELIIYLNSNIIYREKASADAVI
jgi:hypothetical protein